MVCLKTNSSREIKICNYKVLLCICQDHREKRRNVNGIASMRCLSEEWNALSRL